MSVWGVDMANLAHEGRRLRVNRPSSRTDRVEAYGLCRCLRGISHADTVVVRLIRRQMLPTLQRSRPLRRITFCWPVEHFSETVPGTDEVIAVGDAWVG